MIFMVERSRNLPGNKVHLVPFGKMQEILDFLDGDETEKISTPDEGLEEWKRQKSVLTDLTD